ncbi:MAG: universal stress protein [Planctomycetes bacterium]|nr:universal stress protein [Planctomycetota bacterium]
MASILLTTDLSEESQRAFGPARELATRLDATITLVAVLEDLPFEPAGGGMIAAYPDREQIRKDWIAEVDKLADKLGRDVCTQAVVIDAVDVPKAIVDRAAADKAIYICMATHGRSGLRRLLLGSVAEVVIRHSTVPVIVYPPPAH